MKVNFAIAIIIIHIFCFFPNQTFAATSVPATLAITETNITREINGSLFGFNYEWSISPSVLMVNNTTTEINPQFSQIVKSTGFKIPYSRMTGSSSQEMEWKKAIGTMNERQPQQMWSWEANQKQTLGPVEWVNAIRGADVNAKFIWVLNLVKETPADWADLAEFLTGDGTTDPNGGVNWAQRRIDLGVTEPVNIAVWELGNELDLSDSWSVQTYIEKCDSAITAIRSVCPNAKFAAFVRTAPWGYRTTWKTWHQSVLSSIGNKLSYLSFHPYYLGLSLVSIENDFLNPIKSDIASSSNHNIKVYISEHAVWPSNIDDSSTWAQTSSLKGVLGTAQFINRINKRTEIELATYHCLGSVSGPWGLVMRNNDTLYTSAIANMFALYSQCYGSDIKYTLTGTGTNTNDTTYWQDATLTAMVSKQGNGLAVLLVNRSSSDRAVAFSALNNYRVDSYSVLTSNNITDYNTYNSRPVSVVKYVGANDKVTQLSIRPYSMTLFKLSRYSDLVLNSSTLSCGDTITTGNISATFKTKLLGSTSISVNAILALYNGDVLEGIAIKNQLLSLGDGEITTGGVNVTDTQNRKFKMFLWNDKFSPVKLGINYN